MGFEWDEAKSLANIAKHGIPLDLIPLCFEGPVLSRRNDRKGEERWLAVGCLEGLIVAFAYTKRGANLRIISARRANRDERHRYAAIARARGR
jgi:uncharacterized DUF497 family protein